MKPIDLPIKAARTECALPAVMNRVTEHTWNRVAKGTRGAPSWGAVNEAVNRSRELRVAPDGA